MNNTDEFNRCAARLLTLLHESFPRSIYVNASELDDQATRAQQEIYAATLLFLADEGFVRFREQVTAASFQGVSLTAKGLTVLNSVPSAIGGQSSVAAKVKNTLVDGSREALRGVIGELLKLAIGL